MSLQATNLSMIEATESLGIGSFLKPTNYPGAIGTFGEFTLIRMLGSGASSLVFEAYDPQLKRRVVLKVMRPELARKEDHQKRFLREARAVAAITSDYTIPIHQIGAHGGLPYIEMPLLAGETLQDRLQRDRRIAVNLSIEIIRQVVLGLQDAHNQGMVHRDIKPANIWLEAPEESNSEFKRVRILDFGLAREHQQPIEMKSMVTVVGGVIGTPHFMSPEQAEGKPLDQRSDIFSLGIMWYAMLTGRLPFLGDSMPAVLLGITAQPHKPIRDFVPNVPGLVCDLIDWMLSKNPEHRPNDAGEILASIDELRGSVETITSFGDSSIIRVGIRSATANSERGGLMKRGRSSRQWNNPTDPKWPTTELPNTSSDAAIHKQVQQNGRLLKLIAGFLVVCIIVVGTVVYASMTQRPAQPVVPVQAEKPRIPVGLLFARSGTMKISEESVEVATLLAIDEVNAAGGINGVMVEPIHGSGIDSTSQSYAKAAENLLQERKAVALFGCWTSCSRKSVLPVLRQHNALLFYPVQYEGLEQSEHVVYLGPTANQQLFPALDYLIDKAKAKTVALVGSDYVYPRSANEIIKDELVARGTKSMKVVSEQYCPLGCKDWDKVVDDLLAKKPDVIINSINGTSAFSFYETLRREESLRSLPRTPVLSLSLTQNELQLLPPDMIVGDYLAGSYFSSLTTDSARAFNDKIQKRSEGQLQATDMMAAAYTSVHLWAAAARQAPTLNAADMLSFLRKQTYEAPTGSIRVDENTLHLWQPSRIAQFKFNETKKSTDVAIVHAVKEGLVPKPYPATRTPAQWNRFLGELYRKWDGDWAEPIRK
jgi:urea transport system substrate-binding protein